LGRGCTVCNSADRDKIEIWLRAGVPDKEIVQRVNRRVSANSISRHKNNTNCFLPPVDPMTESRTTMLPVTSYHVREGLEAFTLHSERMTGQLEREVRRYYSRVEQMRKFTNLKRVTVSLTKKQVEKLRRIQRMFPQADVQSLLYAFAQIGRYNAINQLQ
jgi:hypothetical protein